MSSKRIFRQKTETTTFMKEPYKLAKQKEQESSEKRAVLKEHCKHATHKLFSTKKNRQHFGAAPGQNQLSEALGDLRS